MYNRESETRVYVAKVFYVRAFGSEETMGTETRMHMRC